MPYTRRQNAKATRYREISDFSNMGVLLGNENVNPIEKQLAIPSRIQSITMALSLIRIPREISLMRMKLEILAMKTLSQERIES